MATRDKTTRGRARLVSFSGIDGAGKSTQIRALCRSLNAMGLRVRTIAFWDEIARGKGIRETAAHALFKGDKGVGRPEAPIVRRDKNVRSWSMTLVRLCIYLCDALSARMVVAKARRGETDYILLDRYVYDELANLNLRSAAMRAYCRLILKIALKPDVSLLLDADPLEALARKPEYPLEFLHLNRRNYLEMAALAGMTVIHPMPVAQVKAEILRQVVEEQSAAGIAARKLRNSRMQTQGNGVEEQIRRESPRVRVPLEP